MSKNHLRNYDFRSQLLCNLLAKEKLREQTNEFIHPCISKGLSFDFPREELNQLNLFG